MRIRKKDGGEQRRRFSPMMWAAGLAALALLALGITGTLAQFTASIQNPNNNVSTVSPTAFDLSEALVSNTTGQPIDDSSGHNPCVDATADQTAVCTAINKYGVEGSPTTAPMAPGGSNTTTVQLKNTGTDIPGNLTLAVAGCTQNPVAPGAPNPGGSPVDVAAGNLCATLMVTLACTPVPGSTPVFPGGALQTTPAPSFGPVGVYGTTGSTTYTIGVLGPGDTTDCTFTVTWPAALSSGSLQGLTANQLLTFTLTQTT